MMIQAAKHFVDLPAVTQVTLHLTSALTALNHCPYFDEEEYDNLANLKEKIEDAHELSIAIDNEYRIKSGIPKPTKTKE